MNQAKQIQGIHNAPFWYLADVLESLHDVQLYGQLQWVSSANCGLLIISSSVTRQEVCRIFLFSPILGYAVMFAADEEDVLSVPKFTTLAAAASYIKSRVTGDNTLWPRIAVSSKK